MISFLEKDIEDYLIDQQTIFLNGIEIEIFSRQVNVSGDFIDCIGKGKDDCIYIFEIKKDTITGNALAQLYHYIDYVNEYQKHAEKPKNVKGVLVGTNINNHMRSVLKYLDDIYYIEISTFFDYDTNTYSFTDEFLKSDSFKKSYKKFNKLINGGEKKDG